MRVPIAPVGALIRASNKGAGGKGQGTHVAVRSDHASRLETCPCPLPPSCKAFKSIRYRMFGERAFDIGGSGGDTANSDDALLRVLSASSLRPLRPASGLGVTQGRGSRPAQPLGFAVLTANLFRELRFGDHCQGQGLGHFDAVDGGGIDAAGVAGAFASGIQPAGIDALEVGAALDADG